MDYFEITPQGMAALQQEYTALRERRPALVKRLAAAAALGDRSENAEYTESKRELRRLDSRSHFLDKQMRYGQVVAVVADDQVALGKDITLRFDDEDETEQYHVVGPAEADTAVGNLTAASPLGQALIGHRTGDVVTVHAPAGDYTVTVVDVTMTES